MNSTEEHLQGGSSGTLFQDFIVLFQVFVPGFVFAIISNVRSSSVSQRRRLVFLFYLFFLFIYLDRALEL